MDPSTIATTVVACLTPYLVEGSKEAAKKVGGAVGEKVMKLYDTLKAKLVYIPACEAFILLPIKTGGSGTEYTVADRKGGQPCNDGNGMPKRRP